LAPGGGGAGERGQDGGVADRAIEIIDHGPRPARLVADAGVLAGPARRPRRQRLGGDEIGEGGPALGRARPGRLAAVQPAAAVGHRRLPARAAAPRPRPAARREPQIARRIAVPEPPSADRARGGGRWIDASLHENNVSLIVCIVK
jgi:hypothetical protein